MGEARNLHVAAHRYAFAPIQTKSLGFLLYVGRRARDGRELLRQNPWSVRRDQEQPYF